MALKTVQVSSNLARPGTYSFSPSSPSSYKPRIPVTTPAGSRLISTKKHRKSSVLKCRANLHGCVDEVVQSDKDQTAEIPVVVYPSVVFPGATLRLHAFEFRYRIMMQTLLQEGRTFGVVYCGKDGRMADVGCTVQVIQCERLIDDRFFLTCVGGDRFRVVETVREKPYVVARIQVLSETAGGSEDDDDMGCLVQQVEQQVKNVAMLSEKLNWDLTGDHQAARLRGARSAASFSFLVARLFVDDRSEQLALLRTDGTADRLAREGMYLERRSKYLAAIAAIKDAFQHLSCN